MYPKGIVPAVPCPPLGSLGCARGRVGVTVAPAVQVFHGKGLVCTTAPSWEQVSDPRVTGAQVLATFQDNPSVYTSYHSCTLDGEGDLWCAQNKSLKHHSGTTPFCVLYKVTTDASINCHPHALKEQSLFFFSSKTSFSLRLIFTSQ